VTGTADGSGVRGLVLFRVEGPTGEDAPAESPEALRAALLADGHAVARGTWWCLPWCKCRESRAFSAMSLLSLTVPR